MATTVSTICSSSTTALLGVRAVYRTSCTAHLQNRSQSASLLNRRQSLIMLATTTALMAVETKARAEDIPLFGLRKKLKKVEEAAEEIVIEGVESAERGIETVEREIVTAAKEENLGGGFVQAGVVIAAEAVGVLVATSVVNGILGPG